ncbi:MAG: zinc metallopeptidase [Acholeplasma sp.]|nr:zinc metallopeptidase [Acholeplasma sp.]CCY27966.1 bH1677 protein [Acholeplasma sp. CAG:878]
MIYGLENILTLTLFIIGFIIVLYAQIKINSTYGKYKNIKLNKNISGQEVARMILDSNGMNDIHVVETQGELTDHYDPRRKVVRLSKQIFHDNAIASVAVAAHEVGHAIQDKENYIFMKIRSILVPVVNFITYIGYIVAFISLLAGITGYLKVSIIIILAALLFQLVTLPVEFDASKRGREQLVKLGIIDGSEEKGVKKMLDAAAFTYVASFISSLLNLLRLIIMLRDRD